MDGKIEVNVTGLTGPALDLAVSKTEGVTVITDPNSPNRRQMIEDSGAINGWYCYSPSTDWSQGGPLIEKYRIQVRPTNPGMWDAAPEVDGDIDWAFCMNGRTPLIAACRAIVAAGREAEGWV